MNTRAPRPFNIHCQRGQDFFEALTDCKLSENPAIGHKFFLVFEPTDTWRRPLVAQRGDLCEDSEETAGCFIW